MTIRFGCPHCDAIVHVPDDCVGRIASCARCGKNMTVPRQTHRSAAPVVSSGEVLYIDNNRPKSWWRMLLLLLGGAACLSILAGILMPALHSRESPQRICCMNNLKCIAMALHNYHEVYNSLPPAYTTDENGRPMHSWRVFLLPFIDRQDLYAQYDFEQPWDSPGNMEVFHQMPQTFWCPSSETEDKGYTNYVVVIGDPDQFPQTMFAPDHGVSFRDVTDGTSNTIMVAEVQTAVPWTMPGADLYFDRMTFRINGSPASIGSNHVGMAHVALGNGSVRALSGQLSAETLRNLLQPADGNAVSEY